MPTYVVIFRTVFTYRPFDPKTVYNAIKEGYRLLDGAGDYGNEKEAGEGVKRAIDDGLVKREDLCACGVSFISIMCSLFSVSYVSVITSKVC